MAYFVITDFSRGRDLRRSQETSPSGTFRILRNAFINEGGEVEKRRAWVKQEALTAYAQDPLRKGRVIGPIRCPTDPDTVFFRHRGNSLPGAPFSAGDSPDAEYLEITDADSAQLLRRFWVQRSEVEMPGSASLARAHVQSQYGVNAYVVESYLDPADRQMRYQHVYVPHVGTEPDGEEIITDNADRPAQMILTQKSYVASGNTLYASALGDPTDMAGTGFWVVDVTTQSASIGPAVALGEYFRDGIEGSYVKPNAPRAFELFQYAASYYGDPEAQYHLSRLYLEGIGAPKDARQAARWAHLSADKGHVDAQMLLGRMMLSGTGMPRQVARGLMWLTLARDGADATRQAEITDMHRRAFDAASQADRDAALVLLQRQVNRGR
jgi:hypothetical protein